MIAFPKSAWSDTEGRRTDASSGSPTGVAERRFGRSGARPRKAGKATFAEADLHHPNQKIQRAPLRPKKRDHSPKPTGGRLWRTMTMAEPGARRGECDTIGTYHGSSPSLYYEPSLT